MEVTLTPRSVELLRRLATLGSPEQVIELALERMVRELADPKGALVILDELDDMERLRKMRLAEQRELEGSQRENS
jgi:hypothetical protein